MTTREFDHTIMPVEGANVMTLMELTALRVYSSSMPEQLSVVMFPATDHRGYVSAGTRLTRPQVVELRDKLTQYIGDGA